MNHQMAVAATDLPSLQRFIRQAYYPGYNTYTDQEYDGAWYVPPYTPRQFPIIMYDAWPVSQSYVLLWSSVGALPFLRTFLASPPFSRLIVPPTTGPLIPAAKAQNLPGIITDGAPGPVNAGYVICLPDPSAYPTQMHFSWKPI
jgi:hypothetical protein